VVCKTQLEVHVELHPGCWHYGLIEGFCFYEDLWKMVFGVYELHVFLCIRIVFVSNPSILLIKITKNTILGSLWATLSPSAL